MREVSKKERRERVANLLAIVGLEKFAGHRPIQLSGGQRQRVAIARALASDPPVILMDEPFGALDAITRGDLQESFLALRGRVTVTTLLVTHDLNEAVRLADRIGVMRRGRIEQLAPVKDVLARPATEYVRRLLQRAGVTG
jgi:osmoprotectant transport system ATP-binding protein